MRCNDRLVTRKSLRNIQGLPNDKSHPRNNAHDLFTSDPSLPLVDASMGRPLTGLDDLISLDLETSKTLDAVRQLSPEHLKMFFEGLFSRMSLSAKETVVELLWTSLTVREQHLFDMPSMDHRQTDQEILTNLSASQLNVVPRRVIRGFQTRITHSSADIDSAPPRTTTGLGVIRNRTNLIWPRMGLLRDLPRQSMMQSNEQPLEDPPLTQENVPPIVDPNGVPFVESVRVQQRREAPAIQTQDAETETRQSPVTERSEELGDHILNILMDVVRGAVQSASDTVVLRQNFDAWREEGLNQSDDSSSNRPEQDRTPPAPRQHGPHRN